MNEQRDKDARIRELLAERALFELSAAEQEELRELLAESSIDQESFERAAAMATLALNPGPHEPLPASFGATVTVHDGRKESRYRIVGVDETDLARDGVSWFSPLARALMNAKVGDRVRFKVPAGEKQLEVRRIEYER